MNTETYRLVIEQWCSATNMERWGPEEVIHLNVAGTPVSLAYDAVADPAFLNVYCDLGVMDRPGLYERLLHANLSFTLPENSHFALHPESGSVICRARVPISARTDGTKLPERVMALVESARLSLMS